MLLATTVIDAAHAPAPSLTDPKNLDVALDALRAHGHCILRGFAPELDGFGALVSALCRTVTFDPAREYGGEAVQKVDAGTAAIGLHVENGNTPNVPELMAFFCRTAARSGSRTTLCDGAALLADMDDTMRARYSQTLSVTRTLPEPLWKGYLANEHPLLADASEVTAAHLEQMLAAFPGQRGELHADGSLTYALELSPILTSALGGRAAFANAILGPSFNYQAPSYRFADGTGIDDAERAALAALAERRTIEIPWADGDVALVDNRRVMHGRREILDAERRELFVGMGNL